jgi:hypothetical protein
VAYKPDTGGNARNCTDPPLPSPSPTSLEGPQTHMPAEIFSLSAMGYTGIFDFPRRQPRPSHPGRCHLPDRIGDTGGRHEAECLAGFVSPICPTYALCEHPNRTGGGGGVSTKVLTSACRYILIPSLPCPRLQAHLHPREPHYQHHEQQSPNHHALSLILTSHRRDRRRRRRRRRVPRLTRPPRRIPSPPLLQGKSPRTKSGECGVAQLLR